ncbi:MAG: hypothetical protein VX689_02090 [Bacteroidota bacterium]|nr:hypothetical protein [Bacteroidota bacterium]
MLLAVGSVFGQDIGTTKINVLEGFKPTVPEAFKLNENATFADTIKKDRTQFYKVIDVNLKSNYKTKPLAVAKVKDAKIAELYATEIEVGVGNAFITKANIVHNSKRSKNLTYGIIANHFANKYFLAKNSQNSMCIYAKKIGSSRILYGNFEYDRRTSFYSPYEDLEFGNLTEEDFRNSFAYTKFSVSIMSNQIYDKKIKNHTTFFVSDLNQFAENHIHLSSNLTKQINNTTYNVDVAFDDYLRYNNSDSKFESTDQKIFNFSPKASFKRLGIDVDLGFDLDLRDDFSPGFFPEFKVAKELVEDVLWIFGGLDHNQIKHTYKSLSEQNPYIHSFGINQSAEGDSSFLQQLKITDPQELYLGMRNLLAKDEVFEGRIAYAKVRNFAHFIHVSSEYYNRFNIAYLDLNQLHVHINYSRKINEIISFYSHADYFSWNVDVYHKPNIIVNFGAPINLRNKIKIVPSVSYIGERVVSDNNVSILPPQTHADLHFYYFYSKQLSASLELNNLTNSKEDLWLGYREVGFNGVFGINFSF